MNNQHFTTTIVVDQSPAEVFNAINNPRGWWSEDIEGITDTLNAEWNYHYQDQHRCDLKIVELIPNKKVVWLVLDNFFHFTKDKSEWVGNTIQFEITEANGKTQLQFTQQGLVPELECYDICRGAWTTYIQKSLFSLITTGKGQPNPKENPHTENEQSFTTSFFVTQTPEQVFAAINNVRAWWQGEIKGDSTKLNDEFDYRMMGIHYSKQRVVEFIPFEKVVWLVTDSNLSSFTRNQEWTGTKIIFDIKEINQKTQVRFTHSGLVSKFQCYGDCSGAWEMLVQQSLFSLITTGKGKDVFSEIAQ